MAGIVVGPDEQRAIGILGKDNVFVAAEVAIHWDTGLPEHPTVPFSDEVLYRCARENKEDQSRFWILIYLIGIFKNVEPGYRLICVGPWEHPENLPKGCELLKPEESMEAALTWGLIYQPDEPLVGFIPGGWTQEFRVGRRP